MSEIKAWANTVGQQIENMTVDLVAQTAAGVSEASGDVFFVGRPAQNGEDWILKKITPSELEKMVYNYLTSDSIAPQLAAVLGELNIETVTSGSIEDDKFRYNGRWYLTTTVEGVDAVAMLETLRASGSRILQKIYKLVSRQVFIRTVASTSGDFSEWKEL